MFEWEGPVMSAFADSLDLPGRALLEVGFGLGVFTRCAQERRPRSHVIIELHPEVAEAARRLALSHPNITVIEDAWQNVEGIGPFDVAFYDSFCPDDMLVEDLGRFFRRCVEGLVHDEAAVAFFVASDVLPPHLRTEALRYFEQVDAAVVRDLRPCERGRACGFGTSIAIPVARRPRRVAAI
jgi:spermidine synthase